MSGRLAFPDEKVQPQPEGSIGIRAYARRRTEAGHPISHTAIGKAIASGRIAAAVWRDGRGRPWINPDLADELFDENTDPAAQREEPKGGRPAEVQSETLFAEGGPKTETVRTSGASARDEAGLTFSKSRATRESYEAELARLEYEKRTGELVRASLVRDRCRTVATLVRQALRNIPARIAGELAAEMDPIAVQERLADEIDRALDDLAELARPLS